MIRLIVALALLLSLAGCKSSYPCDSRERREECENVLGEGYDMARFDEIRRECTTGRYLSDEIILRCIHSYYPERSYEDVEECYENSSFAAFRLTIACIDRQA